jgi:hypothetical protein
MYPMRPELADHPDSARWNARYQGDFVPSFAAHPLAELALSMPLPDGPVLDLACGPSGSTLLAAATGRRVTAGRRHDGGALDRQVIDQRHDLGLGLGLVDLVQSLRMLGHRQPALGQRAVDNRCGLLAIGVRGPQPGIWVERFRVHPAIVGPGGRGRKPDP